MEINQDELCERLAQHFSASKIIPIIGAGCSRTQLDQLGVTHKGFPGTAEYVAQLQSNNAALKEAKSFEEVNQLVQDRLGPGALLENLKEFYGDTKILPTYKLLCRFGFRSVISFNYDESLEVSLSSAGVNFHRIVTNDDVSGSKDSDVILIKPHGTVSRPDTLRATNERVESFSNDSRLVRSLLEVSVNNYHPLFIGYGFGDRGIVETVRKVRSWTKASFLRGTAILLDPNKKDVSALKQLGIDVLNLDAVTALHSILSATVTRLDANRAEDTEDWIKHPFFAALIEIRSKPTETQVIEALITSIDAHTNLMGPKKAIESGITAAKLCLSFRPNYSGLRTVIQMLSRASFGKIDNEIVWSNWKNYKEQRGKISSRISENGRGIINRGDTLLIFSQSQRVIDFLNELEPSLRNSLNIVIAEVRSKSGTPFENAHEIFDRLKVREFQRVDITIDTAAMHLMRTGIVDHVLMGAHSILVDEDNHFLAVINAVGTGAICDIAEKYDIKVTFVAESDKFVQVKSIKNHVVSLETECDLSASASWIAKESDRSELIQVGYDLVHWHDMFDVISDVD